VADSDAVRHIRQPMVVEYLINTTGSSPWIFIQNKLLYIVKIDFDLRKSVPENANLHYERAKKLRGKIPGLTKAMEETHRKIENAGAERAESQPRMREKPQRKWYEKFRWFESSQGYLVIGGRDATTNEILIKKHLEPKDLVFHADIPGAPFFAVKNTSGAPVPDETRRQAAQAAASYSRAWSSGSGSVDVYEVDPGQVSKSAPAGEYLTKGAFMIYGEKRWHRKMELKAAVGVAEGSVIGGPQEAVSAKTKDYVTITVGDTSAGALAKKIRERLGAGELDEIQRFLPPGPGRML